MVHPVERSQRQVRRNWLPGGLLSIRPITKNIDATLRPVWLMSG
jgi:hypothetical protein